MHGHERRSWLRRGASLAGGASILLVVVSALAYWFLSTRPCQSEGAAIEELRAINYGQTEYEQSHPEEGYAATLVDLRAAGLISETLASGSISGYQFTLAPGRSQSSGRLIAYTAQATPAFGALRRCPHFFSDETGVIRFTRENRAATAADSPLH